MNNTPLWMPTGSVRDLVILEVISTVCILAGSGHIEPKDFLVIAMSVISYLFGAKSAQPPANGGNP